MRIFMISLAMGLSACSMTPEYQPPKSDLTPLYPQIKSAVQAHGSALEWRQIYRDPQLQALIDTALKNNHDMRLAVLNVEAVKAQYGILRADQLPAIDGNVSSSRARALSSDPTISPTSLQSQYGVSVGLNAYELDLFGRVRSLSDAALKRYLASEQGLRAARISLISSVADAYYTLLFAKQQSALAEKTLADWKKSLDLAQQLNQADQNNALDVAQAESQVATAEADLEARKRGVEQSHNALTLLVGSPIEQNWKATVQELSFPVEMSSEQLIKRPDIMQVELTLQAANADIGAARAAFFPKIALTASTGYASTQLDGIFSGQNQVWSFAPQITIPIFQAGKLKSELRLAEIRKSVAIVQYEQAIRTAFKDVADGLSARRTYDRQINAQQRVVTASERRVHLSTLRYKAGLDGRLELLDSQRQYYAAQQALLDLQHNRIVTSIGLYKAITAE